mgnify:CR=1 FL=1
MDYTNRSEDSFLLPVGSFLQGGKYRIDQYLSSGGFGNTYLATNVNFEERVAIKEFFMKDVSQRDPSTSLITARNNASYAQIFNEQKEKFKKEARRLRNLHSYNIVAVSDLFDENGTSYYVMDYIDGMSLKNIVADYGPVNENVARNYLEQTMNALEEVHSQNMFHLDLKPANIMVDNTGRVRVIDFGASKQMKPDGSAVSQSEVCFSPGYAPQEQHEKALDKFGPWTDIYALGATMYNVLTAQNPPTSTDIQDEGDAAFVFPPNVSYQMQRLIIWMMKTRRVDRPQNIAQIREFLSKSPEEIMSMFPPMPPQQSPLGGIPLQQPRPITQSDTVINIPPTYQQPQRPQQQPQQPQRPQQQRPQQHVTEAYPAEGKGSKTKYILIAALAAIIVALAAIFLLGGSGSDSSVAADVQEEAFGSEPATTGKVSAIIVLIKSADKLDYYALASNGNGDYSVVKKVQNYTPGDEQVDIAVSTNEQMNQLNKVDALIGDIKSNYYSAKMFFLAQSNLQQDPAVNSINDKLDKFDLGITFFSPRDYSTNDATMVCEFASKYIPY